MRTNTFISIICIFIIISVLSLKYAEVNKSRLSKTSKSQTYFNHTSDNYINEDILIDDHERVIKKPVPIATKEAVIRPYITAESYIIANLETGKIYLKHNPDKVFPIASVSKLYTALAVHHLFDLEKKITITETMLNAYGEAGNLKKDEMFTPNELLHALLLESSNDAALAYEQSFGSRDFMEQMNAFTKEIGMKSTLFKDSSGLSPQNVSNAEDLLVLARYLYKSEKDILEISRTKEITLATTTDHGYHLWKNINPFSNYAGFMGGKTGRTEWAKESMVSLFNQKVGDETYPIAIIVLRSDLGEREINTEKLLGMFMDKVK